MNITFKGVCKQYGQECVFHDLHADVQDGSLLALLGVNGAGKTTLLRMLAGLSGRNKGDILFNDESARRDNMKQRRELCFIPDFPLFFEYHSILESICAYLKFWERPDPPTERILDLLEEFDLLKHADKPMQALSRGQRYKAAFISLILINPSLWLLDEPFASGMDPRGLSAFKRYTKGACDEGNTVIYSTQLVDLAKSFSSNIWLLGNGGIIAQGTADSIDWNQPLLKDIIS